MKEHEANHTCPICRFNTEVLGKQKSRLEERSFQIRHCPACHYSFVESHRVDYEFIYDKKYYFGQGADPMVDYVYEIENESNTIRNYEWQGVYEIFKLHFPRGGRWLDFGCGAGGLVNYASKMGAEIVGAEDGWAATKGRTLGIPILSLIELEKLSGQFDFISAIEVFEHISQPIDVFQKIRKLLKPGGILFFTTGNAKPWRKNLLEWPYTQCPDVHISFFEPETISLVMKSSGFQPDNNNSFVGFTNIIKYKVLKSFKLKRRYLFIELLPWRLIARIVDMRYQVSKHPFGVAA